MPIRDPTAAIRMRRLRRRQREGLHRAQAEVPWRYVELLITLGFLTDDEASDPQSLGNALLSAVKKGLKSV